MRGWLRRSLRYSMLDGVFAAAMTGFTANYISPYAIAMKATVTQIGLLTALPQLVAMLLQMHVADITARIRSRKRTMSAAVFCHAAFFLPIILIPYFLKEPLRVPVLLILVSLHTAAHAFAQPPWASIMADYIHSNLRGKYWGWRNRTLGFIDVGTSFVAGICLASLKRFNSFVGFTTIFSLAMVARFISWYFLNKMHEPRLRWAPEAQFGFFEFIRRIKESNFTKFVFFVSLMNLSVNLSSPFLAVYMLRDLNFSYFTYSVIVTTATLAILMAMRRWGRHADAVGNISVLRLAASFLPVIPVLWIFSPNVIYLLCVQVFAGFFWAGFSLSASNFLFDAVSPEKRTRCISYFNVINCTAVFVGAALGGYLLKVLPPLGRTNFFTLFLLSGLSRAAMAAIFLPMIREVRSVAPLKGRNLLLSVIGVRPIIERG